MEKKKKGKIISNMPTRGKGNAIDWFSTLGMEIVVENYKHGIQKFKVLKVYREDKLTKLSLSWEGKYIGNFDCRFIKEGNIDVLIEGISNKEPVACYDFDETMINF